MARLGAQKTISNFSGGWVTEYSPLDFPANSLSEALNININRDGSIESRPPFKQLEKLADASLYPDTEWEHVKTFYLHEGSGTLTAYLSEVRIFFVTRHKGITETSMFNPKPGQRFIKLEDFDVTAIEGGFIFATNEETWDHPTQRDSQVFKAEFRNDGTIIISDRIREVSTGVEIRVPSEGYRYVAPSSYPGNYGDFTGIRYVQTMWFRPGSSHNYLGKVEAYIYEGGVVVGGPYASWEPNETKTVSVGGELRTYYRGDYMLGPGIQFLLPLPATSIPAGSVYSTDSFLFSFAYTTNQQGAEIAGAAGKIAYRDTFGVPHLLDNINQKLSESVRFSDTSAFMNYNIFNAGWRLTNEVSYAAAQDGSTTATTPGSLANATRTVAGLWPCLVDSPDAYKIDKANSVKALGLFSPSLLAAEAPLVGRPSRGSHILHMTGEYKGRTHNPHLFSYFTPAFDTSLSEILNSTEYEPWGLDVEFYNKAREVSNSSHISSCAYINGRVWYGVTHPSFNLAFSQVEETPIKGFSGSPEAGHLSKCYQETDPNAPEFNQLVATDGGTMSLRDVGTIKKIIGYRHFILLFSEEGVWSLTGEGGNGSFSPLAFSIDKVSGDGIVGNQNILSTPNGVYYISKNSIHFLTTNERGALVVLDIANDRLKEGVKELVSSYNNPARSMCNSISYDKVERKVFFNYALYNNTVSPLVLSIGAKQITGASSVLANGLNTMVFDEALGAFYNWRLSTKGYWCYWSDSSFPQVGGFSVSSFYYAPGEEPVEGEILNSPLGVFYSDATGLISLYEEFNLQYFEGLVTNPNETPLGPVFSKKMRAYRENKTAGGLYDGPATNSDLRYPCSFRIPYETFGGASVDKSIATTTFFQDSERTGQRSGIVMLADWDNGGVSNPVTMDGNIRYPGTLRGSHLPRILSNKIKIPGSGKYLSLGFTNLGTEDDTGFSLLGYDMSVTIEDRA